MGEVERRMTYGTIQTFDELVPGSIYEHLLAAAGRIGWRYGKTNSGNTLTRYWHHEVGRGEKHNLDDVSETVGMHPLRAFSVYQDWLRSKLVPSDTKILRYYLNAHTYGTDGWPHTDTERTGELTSVLYLVPAWKPEWGGETVVFNNSGDIETSVLPRPNRLLVFPSDRLHSPRPLSRAFTGLRIVLVVKMGPANAASKLFIRSV